MYRPLPCTGLLCPALLASTLSVAQPEADYELITTAIHTRTSETALPVTVLSGDELHRHSRATLGDTLSSQPGISTASFGPAVGQTVIRGQTGRRVMDMTNAIANADASGNSNDHALTIEAVLADAIEVLRGPSTLLYGGGAIGGVVNTIDSRIPRKPVQETALSMEARHDTASDQNNVIGRLDMATGSFSWHLDALDRSWHDLDIPGLATAPGYEGEDPGDVGQPHGGHTSTNGYIDNTGGETRTWTAGGAWHFNHGFIGLSLNELDNLYGLPAGAHAHHEVIGEDTSGDNISIDMNSRRYDLAAELNYPGSLVERLDYRMAVTDYRHSEMEAPGITGTTFNNDSRQFRLQLNHRQLGRFHGVIGLQHTDERFGATGEESFIPVSDISSTGLFLVEDIHYGRITWEFGARLGQDSYTPWAGSAPARSFNTSALSMSALADLGSAITMGLNLSRSQRAPSIEELYSNHGLSDPANCVIHLATASCELGNHALNRETAINTDLTLFYDMGRTSATFTLFHNRFDDYLYQQNTGLFVDEYAVREYAQADARFTGMETELLLDLAAAWQLRLLGDIISSHIDRIGDAPRLPPARIGLSLEHGAGPWQMSLGMQHAYRQDDPGANELATASYTRWDASIDYTIAAKTGPELMLFIRLRNITDEEIRLATSILRGFAPESGRSLESGIRLRF